MQQTRMPIVFVLMFWFVALGTLRSDLMLDLQISNIKNDLSYVFLAVGFTISYIRQPVYSWPTSKYFNLFLMIATIIFGWFAFYFLPKNFRNDMSLLLGIATFSFSFFGKSQKTNTKNI